MSRGNFVLANQNLEQSMNNLNSLKSAELIEIATNAAPADKAAAKSEIKRRHENRMGKGKKAIPAVAKFLGIAPATPADKPKASEKPAKPAKVEKTDAELEASYAKCSAAFLKNMLVKTKDPRKLGFIEAALAAKSPLTEIAPQAEGFADLVSMLGGMSAADKAAVMAALSA